MKTTQKTARRGGKKNRKHGRNARRPSGLRQQGRTARNKAGRMAHCEWLAGRRLPWPNALEATMAELVRMRRP